MVFNLLKQRNSFSAEKLLRSKWGSIYFRDTLSAHLDFKKIEVDMKNLFNIFGALDVFGNAL